MTPPSPPPPLPIEILQGIAQLCHPIAARNLRNADRTTRKNITQNDLVLSEFNWRHTTKGEDNCWHWSVQQGHERISDYYWRTVGYDGLGSKIRAVAETRIETLLRPFINILAQKYAPELLTDDGFLAKLTRHLPTYRSSTVSFGALYCSLASVGIVGQDRLNHAFYTNWDQGGRAILTNLMSMNLKLDFVKAELAIRVYCLVSDHAW
ncbi:hypothetical protein HDV00_012554 [Rhizophlyctis rosea]|nr:hypothetical protein HDV00_012554 [Rhizophlyctis rosea]